jgi:hypothetical protein
MDKANTHSKRPYMVATIRHSLILDTSLASYDQMTLTTTDEGQGKVTTLEDNYENTTCYGYISPRTTNPLHRAE